jgi:hypothetical protein
MNSVRFFAGNDVLTVRTFGIEAMLVIGREALQRVLRLGTRRAVDDHRADGGDAEGVAVRRRIRDLHGPERAGGAPTFSTTTTCPISAHLLRGEPRDDVGASPAENGTISLMVLVG